MSETTGQPLNSILTADFGSVNTRVTLVGLVNGRYRLLGRAAAPTTALPPFGDVGEGLRHALYQLSEMTGRFFLNGEGTLVTPEKDDGTGVDCFVATASGGRPMRTVLLGLVPEISLESGRRASASTYMTIEDSIHLADPRSEVEQIDAILNITPDLLFVVGGTDDGSEQAVLRMIHRVKVALSLMGKGHRLRVLFAGNVDLQAQVKAMLENEDVDLRFADNVRPSLADETLESAQARLAAVYDDYMSHSPGGFAEISHWSKVGVLPTAQSFSQILGFMEVSQRGEHAPVLGVDLGSATTMLAAAWRGRRYVSVRSDLGLGHSAVTALDAVDLAAMARWLSFDCDLEDLRDYVWNKWLRPATIPQTMHDLEIEMALAREIIRAALTDARRSWRRLPRKGVFLPDSDAIVLAGAIFGNAPHPGHAALLALDALQPVGITRLLLDSYGLVPGMGASSYLGAVSPLPPVAVSQVLGTAGLPALATVAAPIGRVQRKQVAMQVQVSFGGDARAPVKVRAGRLRVIPIEPGRVAEVTIKPHRRWDLGAGKGRPVTFTVEGSILGLVCDARGRPLTLPRTSKDRARIVPRWLTQITGKARPTRARGEAEAVEDQAEETLDAELDEALGELEEVGVPEDGDDVLS